MTEHYQKLFLLSHELACVANSEGYFELINPAFEQILGYSIEELMPMPYLSLIHPDDTDRTIQELEKIFVKGIPTVDFTIRIRCKNNTYKHINWFAVPDLNTGVMYVTGRDVTQHYKMAELLKRTERIAKIGGWEFDVQTMTGNASNQIYRIYELPHNESMSLEESFQMFHPTDRPTLQRCIELAMTKGESYDLEIQVITAKNNTIWVRAKGEAVWENGKVVSLKGTLQDIDDLKTAELNLLAINQELSASNKNLEEFAYIASHDLQEPLRKIVAFGERLKSTNQSNLTDKGLLYLSRITNAAGRMQQLIDDLLAYSRVARGKDNFFQTVDVKMVLNNVLLDMELSIQEKQAVVDLQGVFPPIRGIQSYIRQLFQNLITNALKFQQPNQTPNVQIKGALEADQLVISVQDNGIGIKEKYLERIFLPFHRLHGRTEYKGTGIGLAICQKIVAMHQGTIRVESEVGKGTIFIVQLPLTDS